MTFLRKTSYLGNSNDSEKYPEKEANKKVWEELISACLYSSDCF